MNQNLDIALLAVTRDIYKAIHDTVMYGAISTGKLRLHVCATKNRDQQARAHRHHNMKFMPHKPHRLIKPYREITLCIEYCTSMTAMTRCASTLVSLCIVRWCWFNLGKRRRRGHCRTTKTTATNKSQSEPSRKRRTRESVLGRGEKQR